MAFRSKTCQESVKGCAKATPNFADIKDMRHVLAVLAFLSLIASLQASAKAQVELPAPLVRLRAMLANVGQAAPGRAAIAVQDLATGYTSGYNMNAVMPAASTIKVPVMVEVFKQMAAGKFDLNRRVELYASDRDWGSGDIAASPVGSTFPVSTLLTQMITVSDNTAANMLIRLVGRRHINATMADLGLHHTDLADYIRTAEWSVRTTLRTTPADMVKLLTDMAKNELIDEWSSKQMIAILEHQEINTLIPAPLPQIPIAHKTGSFADTLNDVGIVYADSPYVIAVLTTDLSSLGAGRQFIHRVSSVTYSHFQQLAKLRAANAGLANPPAEPVTEPTPDTTDQDVPMWATPAPSPSPV
jgi:beta-lactamase class A